MLIIAPVILGRDVGIVVIGAEVGIFVGNAVGMEVINIVLESASSNPNSSINLVAISSFAFFKFSLASVVSTVTETSTSIPSSFCSNESIETPG